MRLGGGGRENLVNSPKMNIPPPREWKESASSGNFKHNELKVAPSLGTVSSAKAFVDKKSTDMQEKAMARLRESSLLAPSGRGGRVRTT